MLAPGFLDGHHLAELNVARAVAPADSPELAAFTAAVWRVNAMAERSAGFIWRMKDETPLTQQLVRGPHAIGEGPKETLLVNMSVWADAASFEHFVWKTYHRKIYERREEWFVPLCGPGFVMWRIGREDRPTPEDCAARLFRLRREGPSPQAFGWAELRAMTSQTSPNPNGDRRSVDGAAVAAAGGRP